LEPVRIQRLSVADALRSLRSDAQGLASAEALRRMGEYGPNLVQEIRGRPLTVRFLAQFTHFFALILWVAAALAFVAGRSQPGGGMATLGCAILGVILVNGVFSFWQEYRAERAITALRRLLPQHAKVLRDGKLTDIPAIQLVPGDVLLLEEGDVVPADCRLLDGVGIRVNAAAITGESVPVSRTAGPSDADDVIRAANVLLAGTSLVGGQGRALAFATGMHTEFGKIAGLTQAVVEPPTPLQEEIARLSRLVAIISTSLGAVFFGVGLALGLPFWGNLTFAIGIIVANVPEGLLPTVTLALAAGARRMARHNALVRHLPSVEALGAVTVICTDKTGTLTTNCMTVRRLYLSGRFLEDGPEVARTVQARSLERRLFEAARLCHDLKAVEHDGRTQVVGDPMEAALVASAVPVVPDVTDGGRLDEIPFDGDRKRLAVLQRTEAGAMLYVKGALETVLPLCRKVVHETETLDLTPKEGGKILAAQRTMADAGLRVIAFAYRQVAEPYERDALEVDLTLSGLVGLEDPPRPEVPDAIRRCREAGIRVIMITGDHPSTAVAIGREIGLLTSAEPLVYRGEDLRRVSDTQLQLALDAPEIVFARVDPDQKMRIVRVLKRKGAIIVAQIANVFLCRSETRSALRLGLLTNPLILGGILGEVLLILAIVYLPVGHRVFGTAPIPPAAWLVAAACAIGMFGLEEARKAVRR